MQSFRGVISQEYVTEQDISMPKAMSITLELLSKPSIKKGTLGQEIRLFTSQGSSWIKRLKKMVRNCQDVEWAYLKCTKKQIQSHHWKINERNERKEKTQWTLNYWELFKKTWSAILDWWKQTEVFIIEKIIDDG